jgi:hypothetical protein
LEPQSRRPVLIRARESVDKLEDQVSPPARYA